MTCVKSLYSGGTAVQNKDWASLGASAGTIVGKGLIYASKQSTTLANALKASGTKVLPTPTAIVDAAALALLLVDFLNGFGTPNSGSAVSTAADKLDLFMKDLDPGCVPDARDWSGTAATAYTGQNALLKGYAQQMKELDATLKGYLGSQAAKVKEAHMCITVCVAVLTAAAGVALALYLIPLVGPEVSCAWQIIAAFACCAAVLVIEMLTLSNSMSLSNDVAALGQKYVALGKDVETKLAGSFGKIQGKVATETSSKLSGFHGISDGLTSFSFAPSLSDLAAKAGDKVSSPQRALLDASSGKEDAAAKSPAGAKVETPSATTPAAAATPAAGVTFTPPSLAQMSQMSQMSAQISQMSQPISNLSQTVNQGVSQIQQLAQSAKGPGDPAALAADEVDDVKDAQDGAASGSGGTERAPIDAATSGAEPAGAGRERVL
jgi:EspA/EspE family